MKIFLVASVAILTLAAMAPVDSNSKLLTLLVAGGDYVGTSQQVAGGDYFGPNQQVAGGNHFESNQQVAGGERFESNQQVADGGDYGRANASA